MGDYKFLDKVFVGPLIVGLIGLAFVFVFCNLVRSLVLKTLN